MNKKYTLLSLCTLLLGLFMLRAELRAQITNGQVNYELRVDQWYQSCDNDWASADDNEVRIGLSGDGNTGGTASWTSGGNGASCGGNLYVRRWQADAPSTVTNNNTLLYYCTNRNNVNDFFTIYYNSWEEDGSPDCDPSGDACQSSGSYNYTFKSASKTPSLWWGYTGTLGGSFMTGQSGDFFAKTVWRYTYGDACGNPLNFGTLASGTARSHTNSNRPAPGGSSGNMGYTNVSGNTSPDVFYQFTISAASNVVISTDNAGSDYDTYIRLYTSGCGTQIAFNDDFGGSTRSTINMDLCAGTYIVQVEGFSTNTGNFNLSVLATAKPATGGTISGIANGVTICPGADPGAFSSSVDGTGSGGLSYQWESSVTSAGAGYSNISGETGTTYDVGTLSQTTWFRRRVTDACGQVAYSNVIQVVVGSNSTAPTAITGTTTICAGNSTTLTLSGGSAGTGAIAEWFSGSCGGTAVGTGNSITVSPGSTTTYFVRYSGTCNTTSCASATVTVNTASTAPTAITGTTSICAGNSTTLTLSGGSAGTGATAQWFSGSCGGTAVGTGNSITVSPGSTTTYFVRYSGTCNTTTCASATVTVNSASTAPTAITGTTSICAGNSTTLTLSGGSAGTGAIAEWFSGSCGGTLVGTGNSITVSPGSTTTYFVRYSGTCNTTTCASATVTVNSASTAPTAITGTTSICAGNSTTLTLSGGSAGTGATAQWFSGSCGGTAVGTGNSITVSPGSTTTYFVRYSGTCNTTTCASATVTVNSASTAPTSITGTTSICAGNSTTLTLSGGSAGTGATAEWFSGSCGGTAVGTGNSITVSPGSTTTYFVRYSGTCNTTTCASATVTVNSASTAPTAITGTTSICAGNSTTLTLSGGSAGTGAIAEWFSGSCGGTAVGTGNSITVSPGSTTTYFVRYSGTCNTTTCASATVTVNSASTAPTAITGTTTICAGNSTTLTLSGGSAGTGATAQWFSGSCGGTAVGTGNSITVSPGSTTTYFVRYSGTCNTTTCASATVTVNAAPATFTPVVSTSTPLCYRGNAEITIASSQAGTDYYLRDNTTTVDSWPNSAGGTIHMHTLNLTAGTSGYDVVATTAAGCSLTVSVPAITVTGAAGSLANNNDSRSCYVNGNNTFVEFISSGRSIIAINPGTQNLGDVTVTEYVNGSPIGVQACNTNPVTQPEYNAAAMDRHWVISSTIAPVSPVDVRLYIADADITSLAASANANANMTDDVAGIGSLQLTKYSGPNENASFADNCNTGGITTLHTQNANGAVTAPVSGNAIAGASYIVYSVGGFSELWLGGSSISSPLPVELAAFDVSCTEGTARINWTTASEVNNHYFTVERSADDVTWTLLATVPGAGNSNSPLQYTVTDDRPEEGITYYRLRQTDYNGTEELFPEKSIYCTGNAADGLLLYPNPATDQVTLSLYINEASDARISISDARGAVLRTINWPLTDKGMHTRTIPLDGMAPGMYIMRVQTGKTVRTISFIKR